ncbi:MAG TPA: nuclear transport factor 2 family protein [Vicinamibacterales bacterium]|nr:nuclear transport factor 2 family protein [Vicinamibacterales bacterium]
MLAVLSLALVTLQNAPAIAKDAADLKELYRLETVWNEAHVKGDADTLDKLWAPDLVVTIAAMPQMTKADALAMVRSNKMPFTKYETSELNVRQFRDSALVTGRLHRERIMAGKSVTDNWRFTKVYAMSNGQWRVIAWHASPAPQ